MMLNNKAPEFVLEASTGHTISLKDLLGSFIVLIFYPMNDTPICNGQLDEISLRASEFLAHGARVFGINTATASKHREYCSRRRLEFPILSDPSGHTAQKYGAWMRWMPLIKRTVAVIDPKGVICFYEHGKPPASTILDLIAERVPA